ncbi:MAG: cytochrome C oxidase subunit IV family protein [Halieaceae bacterium]|nr:cytochrome C oxidase subunit IV family protein [Halieaceae bacterium]
MYKEEKYLAIIWLVLIGVSLLSWKAGASSVSAAPLWLVVPILLLTFTKVRFVVLDFMEVRHAPIQLRLILEAWLALTCLALVLGYSLDLCLPTTGNAFD